MRFKHIPEGPEFPSTAQEVFKLGRFFDVQQDEGKSIMSTISTLNYLQKKTEPPEAEERGRANGSRHKKLRHHIFFFIPLLRMFIYVHT